VLVDGKNVALEIFVRAGLLQNFTRFKLGFVYSVLQAGLNFVIKAQQGDEVFLEPLNLGLYSFGSLMFAMTYFVNILLIGSLNYAFNFKLMFK